MNAPKNHHFIPKVYLKEFANYKKELFQLSKSYSKISIKSISNICYRPNYFKLSSLDSIYQKEVQDVNHIELNAFKRQENLHSKLLKKVTRAALNSIEVSRNEAEYFLEILMTFKRRGPIYRKELIEGYKSYIQSDKFRKLAEQTFPLSREQDDIDPEAYFTEFVSDQTTSEDKQSDMYLKIFIDEEDTIMKDVAKLLMQFKLFMFHAPLGYQFITSDNPGFTQLMNNQLLSFGAYKEPFYFFYPLTPTCCLYIDHLKHDNTHSSIKTIHIQHITKDSVNLINANTYQTAMEKVFAYNSDTLLRIMNL